MNDPYSLYGLTKEEWHHFSESREWKAIRLWAFEGKQQLKDKALEGEDMKVIYVSKGANLTLNKLVDLPEGNIAAIEAEEEHNAREGS